jgi:hypothetical protein
MTPVETAALALVSERRSTLFPIEDDGAQITAWDEPYLVPSAGIALRLNLYDKTTYRGPSADLLVVPAARLHDPAAALDALAAALSALRSRGLSKALSAPLEDTLGLPAVRYTEGMFSGADASRRRAEALAAVEERFDAVAARMKEVYGLRLPRYLATFAAFWRSLDPLEHQGMSHLGRRPGGILVWFEDGGLERKTRDGLDPRLECRFRSDPPELCTVMWGDSDGLHFGLWYDDPADMPTCVAHNYARDSAETWRDQEPTPLAVVAAGAREYVEEQEREREPISLSVHAAREALAWFAAADRVALEKDPPAPRWLKADRIPTLGTFGPALPPGAGTIRVGDTQERSKAWRTQGPRVAKWIASAKRDCAEGKPAAALTFGLDLHWLDAEEHRADALALMVMAYEKLGRHAHAETVKVHYAHRDLTSVDVFLPRDGE